MDKKGNIIISEGERPIWHMVIAAFFYTLSLFFIGYFTYRYLLNDNVNIVDSIAMFINVIFLAILSFTAGISFSRKNTLLFDLENKKLKDQYSVGPFKVGKWKSLPMLNYISIFKNTKGFFELNLWYNKNQHFNIYTYFDRKDAIENGYLIADKLNIKLLDATKPNDYKYLDMRKLKEKYNN